MRVLIFGGTGMLGHKLYQRLQADFDVYATIRTDYVSVERFGIFEKSSIVENVDITDANSTRRAIELTKPDCVINAVGVIKQLPEAADVIGTLMINSIFPHRLAELSREYDFRLITTGTDCVFDGRRGNYTEDDVTDARDVYGLSKFLGEVTTGNCLTVRTSIIGRELETCHSILEWFLSHREASVRGYVNAIYSGFPTIVLSDIIRGIIVDHPSLHGLYHVSADPISKFELLNIINEVYGTGIQIEPFEDYHVDRSLDSTKFRTYTGFAPLGWREMIELLAADPTPYEAWHLPASSPRSKSDVL